MWLGIPVVLMLMVIGIELSFTGEALRAMYTEGGVPCRVEPCPNAEARIGDAFWIGFRALMGDEATTAQVAEAIRSAAQLV